MRKTIWAVVSIIIMAIVLVVALRNPRHSPSAGMTFGAVLPLTGDIAEYGVRCKNGMDLAVDDINREGGVRGTPLRIVYEDSTGLPRNGVSALQKLISVDRVNVVIGGVASSVTLAMEPIATDEQVLLMSPASSSPKLTGISQFFFRVWPSDVLEATALAEFTHTTLRLQSIAIVYVNNDYGIGLRTEFSRRFIELGGSIPATATYEQNATDLRTQLTQVAAAAPQGIYLAGYHREMAAATRQIRQLGLSVQILADADYGVDELLTLAGDAAEGAIYATPEYDPAASDAPASVRAFAAGFRERFDSQPSVFEANGYDAVSLVASAIESVGAEPGAIAEFLSQIRDYPGASGLISFGRNHEVEKPVTIKTVRSGAFVPYGG